MTFRIFLSYSVCKFETLIGSHPYKVIELSFKVDHGYKVF